jgi:hypothetical protein
MTTFLGGGGKSSPGTVITFSGGGQGTDGGTRSKKLKFYYYKI